MPKLKPVPQTPESLGKIAASLHESATGLEVVATSMQLDKFDHLMVVNYEQLRRSITFLERFLGSCREALRDARAARGDFAGKGHRADTKRRRKTT